MLDWLFGASTVLLPQAYDFYQQYKNRKMNEEAERQRQLYIHQLQRQQTMDSSVMFRAAFLGAP